MLLCTFDILCMNTQIMAYENIYCIGRNDSKYLLRLSLHFASPNQAITYYALRP